jgi:hypothetical protein
VAGWHDAALAGRAVADAGVVADGRLLRSDEGSLDRPTAFRRTAEDVMIREG